jgi:endonuclease-3
MSARPVRSRRESKQGLLDRTGRILAALRETYPDVECALNHTSAYELLAATILSAQCTDERVNLVTPALFQAYPTPAQLARARQEDVEQLVKSTGFFRNKAANLIGMARAVVEQHGGEIPMTLDELVALPGVGRKTANVLLGTFHGIPSGVVVDTHVQRITKLLGLTKGNSAEAIERDLMEIVPQAEWIMLSHRLIHHGRRICIARRPQCGGCPLLADCKRVGFEPLAP